MPVTFFLQVGSKAAARSLLGPIWARLALFLCVVLLGPVRASPAFSESPHYRIAVIESGRTRQLHVACTVAQKPETNLSRDVSWASFDLSAPATIEVNVHAPVLSKVRVLPSHRGIQAKIHGQTVRFTVKEPGPISVEINESIAHPLLLFVQPPSPPPPHPDDPRVIYFGPGLHAWGERYIEPKAGQIVYLAEGSIVQARIRLVDAPGVTIRGRGVLSGRHLPANPPGTYTVPHLIEGDAASTGVTIEGITLVDSPHYNILLRGGDCRVTGVSILGWWYGTDGIGLGVRGKIQDCFLRCNDDALKLYHSGLEVRRCVIWQMENGAPFQLSWNLNLNSSGFLVSDCDIIRVDHRQDANNRAIFNSIHGGSGFLSDYLFENIRIENAHHRFMLLQVKKTNWSKAKEWGRLANITLRNVTADGPFSQRSAIRSEHPSGRIEGVTFDNVRIGGKPIASLEDVPLDIDATTTTDIRFLTGR